MIVKMVNCCNGIRIPSAVLQVGKLEGENTLDLHIQDGMLTILPAKMKVEQILKVVRKLYELQEHLMDHLEKACGPCDECCEDACSLEDEPSFFVADHLLEAANIPIDATLYAMVDAEEGCITIMEVEPEERQIRKLPENMKLLADRGLCIGKVRELVNTGTVVYGNK